jgi:hypothetical protein
VRTVELVAEYAHLPRLELSNGDAPPTGDRAEHRRVHELKRNLDLRVTVAAACKAGDREHERREAALGLDVLLLVPASQVCLGRTPFQFLTNHGMLCQVSDDGAPSPKDGADLCLLKRVEQIVVDWPVGGFQSADQVGRVLKEASGVRELPARVREVAKKSGQASVDKLGAGLGLAVEQDHCGHHVGGQATDPAWSLEKVSKVHGRVRCARSRPRSRRRLCRGRLASHVSIVACGRFNVIAMRLTFQPLRARVRACARARESRLA